MRRPPAAPAAKAAANPPPAPSPPPYRDDEAPKALVQLTARVQQLDAQTSHHRALLATHRKALAEWATWLAAAPAQAKLERRAAELHRQLAEQAGAGANALALTVLRAELAPIQVQQEVLRSRVASAKAATGTLTRKISDATRIIADLQRQRSTSVAQLRSAAPADVALNNTRLQASSQLAAQIRGLSAQLRAGGGTVNGTGVFVRPATGPVTSAFGMRYHPILHYTKLHTGEDFGRGDGMIYAADAGVVLANMTSQAYGLLTIVDHGTIGGRHITTMYAHQSRALVSVGQRVAKGQRIGVIGATGYATGPHLHFEVRDDGAVTDPGHWL
jgi:murein DD-endopeptidase MepM/ murein hydrolase activator NlpD